MSRAAVLERSWGRLGASWEPPGCPEAILDALGAILSRLRVSGGRLESAVVQEGGPARGPRAGISQKCIFDLLEKTMIVMEDTWPR